MIEAAPAKINLHLHVTGRRPDGYHLLDSLVVFAADPAAADLLSAEPASDLTLTLTGPHAGALRDTDPSANLVLRAARALAASHQVRTGARLVLDKRLPVASGIGGGSADAAAALRLLGRLWHIDAPTPPTLAAGLGADVPVCLAARPALMRGVGEELHPAPPLPAFDLLLVNPLVAVATPDVFRRRTDQPFSPPADLPPDGWSTARDLARTLATLRNDLQAPALDAQPVIAEVLARIGRQPGCLLSRMSGSGATCFGLFAPGGDAARACDDLATTGWWVVASQAGALPQAPLGAGAPRPAHL